MRAVLSIPAWWRQDQTRARLWKREPLTVLGRQIAWALNNEAYTHHPVPADFQVEIDWIRDSGNPEVSIPLLFIEVEDDPQSRLPETQEEVTQRFARNMRRTNLKSLIPDCRIRFRFVSEHTASIGD